MTEESAITRERSTTIAASVGEFRDRFSEFAHSSAETVRRLTYAKDISFASLVKLDHVIFKQNGYLLIDGDGEQRHRDVVNASDHQCRLGRWYYDGIGGESFSMTSHYRAMERPHADIHHHFQEALSLAGGEWQYDEKLQQAIIDQVLASEKASDLVMEHIDGMVREKHGQENTHYELP